MANIAPAIAAILGKGFGSAAGLGGRR